MCVFGSTGSLWCDKLGLDLIFSLFATEISGDSS